MRMEEQQWGSGFNCSRDQGEGRKVQVQSAADVRCDVGRSDGGGELMLRCLGKRGGAASKTDRAAYREGKRKEHLLKAPFTCCIQYIGHDRWHKRCKRAPYGKLFPKLFSNSKTETKLRIQCQSVFARFRTLP